MRSFIFDYDGFSFTLYIPDYWDTIYAGKPRENLYHDYCRMLQALKGANNQKYVLDIGANHGLFAVPASKLGYNVICFEPIPTNIESLLLGRLENELNDFEIVELALSNENGEVDMYLPECPDNASFSQAAAVSNMRRKDFTVEKVKTVKFDDWIKENKQFKEIGFIKMDVQGAEYSVLEGMKEFLSNAKDIYLICEYEPHTITMGHSYEDLDSIIKSYGFLFIEHITTNDKLFYKP